MVEFNQQAGQRTAGGIQQRMSLVGVCRCGMSSCAINVVILHLPGKLGAVAVTQNGIGYRARLGGAVKVFDQFRANSIRMQGQHQAGFDGAAMNAKTALAGIKSLHCRPQRQIEPTAGIDQHA